MTTVAVFPGQGAQTVGMGSALRDGIAEARAVFEAVDEALGEPLSRLIFEGPGDDLALTRNAQPALMACSLAAVRGLEAAARRPLAKIVDFVAGHSLGEYSALAAVGALSLADAARLLRLRGEAMQEAVPVGEGAMAALLGLDVEAAEEVARRAREGDGVCEVANDNGEGQVVLSGSSAAIERACELAKAAGARRALRLQVSAPFHCSLMRPAARRLAEALAAIPLAPPARPLLSNVTAAPEDNPERLRELLVEQVTAPVRWRETMARLRALQTQRLIEFGAGRVLTALGRRALKGADLVNVETPEDVRALAEKLA